MCKEELDQSFECISYGEEFFHSDCVGDRMIKDWLIKNGWIREEEKHTPILPKFHPDTGVMPI